jgi:hypothetical protein
MVQTHREQFLKKNNLPKDTSLSLSEISKLSNIPLKALEEVAARGGSAWKNNLASVRLKSGKKDPKAPRSLKMSQNQWAFARVYSFVNRGTTFKTTDSDIARKYGIK